MIQRPVDMMMMASNVNFSTRTYRSPHWRPSETYAHLSSPPVRPTWKDRYKPATMAFNPDQYVKVIPKPCTHTNRLSSYIPMNASFKTAMILKEGQSGNIRQGTVKDNSTTPNTLTSSKGLGNRTAMDPRSHSKAHLSHEKQTDARAAAVTDSSLRHKSEASSQPPNVWKNVQKARCFGMASRSQGDFGMTRRPYQEITSLLPKPVERFGRYNWQEKARCRNKQEIAEIQDLGARRKRRDSRTRPWKDSQAIRTDDDLPRFQLDAGDDAESSEETQFDQSADQTGQRRLTPTRRSGLWTPASPAPRFLDRSPSIHSDISADQSQGSLENSGLELDGHDSTNRLMKDIKEKATIVFQKFLRGYLQRHRFRRLKDRVVLKHSGTFNRFVREYKGLLTRIQKRHAVKKPKTPFALRDVTRFLDRKERYEKIFFNMAIADKIPRNLLKRYFKECGHEPTEYMINEAYTNIFKACEIRADIIFVVDCTSSLGTNKFKTQIEFAKDCVTCLHVGEVNVRVGYVPYNTDVYQSFDLEMYDDVDSVLQGIDYVRYHKGFNRTDRALMKMREMFKGARKDVLKIALLLTDGKFDSRSETITQSTEARQVDKIHLFVVGVGKNIDKSGLEDIAGSRGHVFLLPDYFSIWKVRTMIMKKAKLGNCRFCHWMAPTDLQVDTTRGLYKEEVLEILWQMYPPRGTGIGRQPREMHFVDVQEEIAYKKRTLRLVDEKEAYYSTSLNFAIKSKLDKAGFAPQPVEGSGEASWKESVGAAQRYVRRERDKKRAEQEEREKKAMKAAQKAGYKFIERAHEKP